LLHLLLLQWGLLLLERRLLLLLLEWGLLLERRLLLLLLLEYYYIVAILFWAMHYIVAILREMHYILREIIQCN
jgi:hypothetical protein